MVTITPDKWKRLRWAAIKSGFGFLVFVIALYIAFPSERAKEVAIRQAAAKDLDVEIGSAGPGVRPGRRLPRHPGSHPPRHRQADPVHRSRRRGLAVSLWSVLSASKTYTVSLDAFGGHVDFDPDGAPGQEEAPFAPHPGPRRQDGRAAGRAARPSTCRSAGRPSSISISIHRAGRYAEANGEITFSCGNWRWVTARPRSR